LILVIVSAEPEIMIFTFAFGYSLSGPAWTLYKILCKLLKISRIRKDTTPGEFPLKPTA
jgi:hypothetical protein